MKINENFSNYYLTCGQTYDNFVFENCPKEFLRVAKKMLSKNSVDTKSCIIVLTRDDEVKVENVFEQCRDRLQQRILARDFVTSLVMREVLRGYSPRLSSFCEVNEQIKAFMENDFNKVKHFHSTSFFPSDVADMKSEVGKFELNIFLLNTENVELQRAINNFISSRTSYSIKLFTNNPQLASYTDQSGNYIQSPHDFMTRDVNDYIQEIEICE